MSEAVNVPLALFDWNSVCAMSDIFYISPGWFGVFRAFGFLSNKVPVIAGRAYARQMVCLNQIQLGLVVEDRDMPCGVMRRAGDTQGIEILAEGPVILDSCVWRLSACQTVNVLSLPGAYRLVLNDPAAAGVVQVYLKAYPLTERPNAPLGG
jgi:hypothetical protein